MACIDPILINCANYLTQQADYLSQQWYWTCEPQRDLSARLGASWLARVLDLRQRIGAIAHVSTRPATALWGPSQAGKSSLLAPYIDLQDSRTDPTGAHSALSWSPDAALRFKGDASTPVALNPYNQGKDATGCVTRYTLQNRVDDPAHPVTIRLCSPSAILHALATGYLSECVATNQAGEETFWNPDALRALIDSLPQPHDETPKPQTFARLLDLCRIVGLLIEAQLQRYTNLSNRNCSWRQLVQSELLNCTRLTASDENLDAFTRALLWDSHPAFNDFHSQLLNAHTQLAQRFGDATLTCSLDTAAILINIDSYKHLREPDNSPQTQQFIQRIRALKCKGTRDGQRVAIGADGTEAFCRTDHEFGLFTALILELVIPINAACPLQQDFRTFLETSDILDFPGVAQEDHSQATLLQPDDLHQDDHRLVTQIMKRGKTASIVASYASTCDIDQFLLVIRTKKDLINAGQLTEGIRQWWRAASGYDCKYPTPNAQPPLPLAIACSFSALWINDIIASGIASGGLANVFKDLSELSPLDQSPNSTLFLTTYKYLGCILHLPDGEPIRDPQNCPELRNALQLIRNDDFFQQRIGQNPISNDSFNAMLNEQDGGTAFLFRNLAGAIRTDQRLQRLLERLNAATQELLDALEIACPTAKNDDNDRRQFLETIADRLRQAASDSQATPPPGWSDNASWLAWLIRRLRHIPAEALASVNLNAASDQQLVNLFDELLARLPNQLIAQAGTTWPFAPLGIDTPETFIRLFRTIIPANLVNELDPARRPIPLHRVLAAWYTFNIASISTARRLPALARLLENVIWHGYTRLEYDQKAKTLTLMPASAAKTQDVNAALNQLEAYFTTGDILYGNLNCASPALDHVVIPFTDRLRQALDANPAQRRKQFGDDVINDHCRPPCRRIAAEIQARLTHILHSNHDHDHDRD